MATVEPLYVDLSSEDPSVTEIESLCVKCYGKGVTRLLLTKIPHYKEIILTSFECNDCGEKNNGIQTGTFQDHGILYKLIIKSNRDLFRQIVKSDHAVLSIPELELEIPVSGERGEITTVEGIIQKVISNLNQSQEERKNVSPELYEQVQQFLAKLESLLKLENSFTIVIDDITGNSHVENLNAPEKDPQLSISKYQRSRLQNQSLGLQVGEESTTNGQEFNAIPEEEEVEKEKNLKNEVLQFNTICDQCSRPSSTKMKVVDVPHFKEVVIMATECESCGFKTNEVKGGGGIGERGKKHSLRVSTPEDLARDILKSETCSVRIPELEINAGAGIFVGKFSTVEGLLNDIKDDLGKNPFLFGDSVIQDRKRKIEKLVQEIQRVIDGELEVHMVLDDPAGNSYVQDLYSPDKDPRLVVEEYERSFEQNEELGLNDMKTENYAEN